MFHTCLNLRIIFTKTSTIYLQRQGVLGIIITHDTVTFISTRKIPLYVYIVFSYFYSYCYLAVKLFVSDPLYVSFRIANLCTIVRVQCTLIYLVCYLNYF